MDRLDRQVRYFLKIAQTSSLSKAADELDMSQSGLSRHLAALEAYLGKPLFLRTGRGVVLTDVGSKLVEAAEPAYRRVDAVLEQLREKEGVTEGSLRIATIHTLSYYFVSDLLTRFVSQHERVNLYVLARSSPEVVDAVERGRADIGFVYDSAVASELLESTPLFDDHMCVVIREADVGNEWELSVADLKMPLVGFPQDYALRRMLNSAGLDGSVVAEAETIDAMLRLVSLGIGACILPSHMPERLLSEYGVVKLALRHPGLTRRVVAVVKQGLQQDSLAGQLLGMAVTHASDRPA